MRVGLSLADHFAYHRYISPLAEEFFSGAREKVKVLEIGLGCYQGNTGAGVRMWNDIFKNSQGRKLDLHVMEYDAECAHLWAREWVKRFHHINLRIFTGDQSNEAKLKEILSEGRGEYDAIVDDGGHTMLQQQVSLRVLFPALKPGGFCKRHCIGEYTIVSGRALLLFSLRCVSFSPFAFASCLCALMSRYRRGP